MNEQGVQHEAEPHHQSYIDVNTPVLPVRTVRIAIGSSGGKGRSSGSSGVSKRSMGASDQEMPEDPATVGRPRPAAPQSTMRVKRVGNTAGGFLSGPARRGRRRQSEEDEEARAEDERLASGQEPEGQYPPYMDSELGEQAASSIFAASYRDFASSGSPISAKDSGRAAIRRQASNANLPGSQSKDQERSHLELAYRIPAQSRDEALPNHEKENEAPPIFKRTKPPSPALNDRELGRPSRPPSADIGAKRQPPGLDSPDRRPLAPRSHNTPVRAAPAPPPPPPKMSVVETATAAAGASTAAPGLRKKQVLLRVNARTYTRIDCIGRGGSGKVYRVSAESGKILALKRVSLENADENTVAGFKGEIDLLKRLHGVDRVIQLIDHELNVEKQMLSVVSPDKKRALDSE